MTVLLTSYNRPTMLPDAIGSVLNQTYDNWELLVLDDGSNLVGVIRCLEYAVDLAEGVGLPIAVHRFFPTPLERRATARYATLINWGAAHSDGEYITYLTDDDWYLPDRLERMVHVLAHSVDLASECPVPQVCYGKQELWENGVQTGIRGQYGVLKTASYLVDHNSVMHTRHAFDTVGGWDDSPELWRTADAAFWNRLTDHGFWFYPVEGGPTDAHRFHEHQLDNKVIAGVDPWTGACE